MKEKDQHQEKKKQLNAYVQYSGLGMQMLVLIGGGAYGGHLLDGHLGLEKPWMTILFSMLGIAISFYNLFKGIQRITKDESSDN